MDIFKQQGIQVDDINPIPTAATNVNGLGAATGKPTGRPVDVVPNTAPTKAPQPEFAPSTDIEPPVNPEAMGTIPNNGSAPNEGTQPSPASPALTPTQPTDIFEKEGLAAPTIAAQNDNALQNHVNLGDLKTPPTHIEYFGDLNKAYKELFGYTAEEQKQMDGLAKARFSNEQVAEWKKPENEIGFSEVFNRFLEPTQVTPGGGLIRTKNIFDIKDISEKNARGEQLSEGDLTKVNEFFDKNIEMNQRGFTWLGKMAYIGAQIPAFVAEFALTGGIGKSVAEGAVVAAEKVAMNAALKATVKATAQIATRTALMPAQYAPKYAELRLNDGIAITDKGQFTLRESQESPAMSAFKAFGSTAADVAGQVAVPAIGRYVVEPATKYTGLALKTPLSLAANNLPVATKLAIYDAIKVLQPNAQVSKVFSQIGYKGTLEQLGADRLSEIAHATLDLSTDKNYTFDDYLNALVPTKENFMVEMGLIGVAGGISTSTHVMANLLRRKGMPEAQIKETVDNMSATEKDNFVNENLAMPKSAYPKTNPNTGRPVPEVLVEAETLKDEGGEPITVYHGTIAEFNSFDKNAPKNIQLHDDAQGIYFSDDPNRASRYAAGESGNIHPVNLIMKNPKYTEESPAYISPDMRASLEEQGYDGIIHQNPRTGSTEYVVFDEKQIRSVFESDEGPQAEGQPRPDDKVEAKLIQKEVLEGEKAEPPPIDNSESLFNKLYRLWLDDFYGVNHLTERAKRQGREIPLGQDSTLLVNTNAQNHQQAEAFMTFSTRDFNEKTGYWFQTGKSLKAITDDFDNLFLTKEPSWEQRNQDFNDYLIAQRYLKDLAKNPKVKVTPEQIAKSESDLLRLADKYGQDYHMIEPLAQEIYAFERRRNDMLVNAGVMSKELKEKIESEHPNHVPFGRVMDDTERFFGDVNKRTDANVNKLVKKIKGSEREVENVFTNIIRQTYQAFELAGENRLAGSIVNLVKDTPEYIKEVPALIVKTGTAEVKVTYDPKLRAKLEKAVEQFGATLEKSKSVNVKGFKNVRGSYEPMEKLIRQKIGSNEGTLAHEVGHMLDYNLGLKKKMLSDPKVKEELQKLAEERLGGKIELVQGEEGLRFKEEREKAGDKYEKYIKGDREVLANFYDAYVNSPELLNKIAPNAVKAFDKIIDADPNLAFLKDIKPSLNRSEESVTKDVYGEASYPPPRTITHRVNGKAKYYEVAAPILKSYESLKPYQINATEKMMRAIFVPFRNLLRYGATGTPTFSARNAFKDQIDATIQSNGVYNPAKFLGSMLARIEKGQTYQDWMAAGGKYGSYMALDNKQITKTMKELLSPDGKIERYLKNPLKVMEDFNQVVEQSTRLGVFARAKAKGMSDIEAAYLSLEATVPFQRGGVISKKLNEYLPFFNAAMQGSDKMIRFMIRNPKAAMTWGVATYTIPQMILTGYYLYEADQKTREQYLEYQQWQRDLVSFVKLGGMETWRGIPKAYNWGYTFASIPERMMIAAYQKNAPEGKALWYDLIKGIAGSISPLNDMGSVLPPLIKVAAEDISNYNFFMGRNIYPSWMDSENLPPEMKLNASTSLTSQAIGKGLGVSPAKIDNTVQGLAGGMGKGALSAGDFLIKEIKEWNGKKTADKPITQADLPVIRAFTPPTSSGYRSNSYQSFQNNLDEAQQKRTLFKNLEGEEKSDFAKEHRAELAQYDSLKSADKQIRSLGKEMRGVYKDVNISGDEKVKRINKLEDNITLIARQANLRYIKATKNR